MLNAVERTIDASEKFLHQYIDFVKQANDEPDIDKKFELFNKANEAYKKYELSNKKYDSLNRKLDEGLGLC